MATICGDHSMTLHRRRMGLAHGEKGSLEYRRSRRNLRNIMESISGLPIKEKQTNTSSLY